MIAAEKGERIDLEMLRSRKVGRYGIKIESSSSTPTARYANFMSILEIARMYPDRIGPEMVIEYSDLPKKELILQQVKPAERSQNSEAGSQKRPTEKKIRISRDQVNFIARQK